MATVALSYASAEQRRSRSRAKLSLHVRVRGTHPEKWENFEEVRATQNVSSSGLYFTTWRGVYEKGMQLGIIVPYYSSSQSINSECLAEVVRIDRLGEYKFGIAVKFVPRTRSPQSE
jgi:hypothetical protein